MNKFSFFRQRTLFFFSMLSLFFGAFFVCRNHSGHPDRLGLPGGYYLAQGLNLTATANTNQQKIIKSIIEIGRRPATPESLTIDYPRDGTIFPPEMVAPKFFWHDYAAKATQWVIDVELSDGAHICFLVDGQDADTPHIDERCLSPTNEIYKGTSYQQSARTWTPDEKVWAVLRDHSGDKPVDFTLYGFKNDNPNQVLSMGRMQLTFAVDSLCQVSQWPAHAAGQQAMDSPRRRRQCS